MGSVWRRKGNPLSLSSWFIFMNQERKYLFNNYHRGVFWTLFIIKIWCLLIEKGKLSFLHFSSELHFSGTFLMLSLDFHARVFVCRGREIDFFFSFLSLPCLLTSVHITSFIQTHCASFNPSINRAKKLYSKAYI